MSAKESAKVRFIRSWVRFMTVMWRSAHHLQESYGLSGPQFGVLRLLEGLGHSSMGDLDPFLPGRLSALTQMVDRLVQGGWVRRKRDPEDRRRVVLYLTDKAREVLARETPIGPARAVRLIDDMPPEEGNRLACAMEAVVEAMIGDATADLPDELNLPWIHPHRKET